MAIHIFDEDHRAIEQNAEIDGAHRQHVRRHSGEVETHERDQKRERHRDGDGERPGKRPQEEPEDQRHERRSLDHVARYSVERRVDESRAIVKGNDVHPFR